MGKRKPERNRKSSEPKTKKSTQPTTSMPKPEPHSFVINMKYLAAELYHRYKTHQLRPGDRELFLGFEQFNKRADQLEVIKAEKKELKEEAEEIIPEMPELELALQPVAKLSRAPATAAAKSASKKKKLKQKK